MPGSTRRERGVPRTFVWALPQVCRDGYTGSLPQPRRTTCKLSTMFSIRSRWAGTRRQPGILDQRLRHGLGYERRNLWSDARLRFDVGPGIRSEAELGMLIAFFRARRGAARGFRLCDPFDFSSNGMTGTPTMIDQRSASATASPPPSGWPRPMATGDEPQIRPITRPRAETLLVSVGGVNHRLDPRRGGTIMFDSPPPTAPRSAPASCSTCPCVSPRIASISPAPPSPRGKRRPSRWSKFARAHEPGILRRELETVATFWRILRKDGIRSASPAMTVTCGSTASSTARPGHGPSAIRRTAGWTRQCRDAGRALS